MRKIQRILMAAALLAGHGALAAESGPFHFFGPISRVITPNGDHKNDGAIFCFDNFGDSDVEGRIFTLLGAEVADLTLVRSAMAGCSGGDLPQHMLWDGRSNGTIAAGGVYVYQIRAEGKTFTGSLLVVR